MTDIDTTEAIQALDAWLREHRPDYCSALRPPLSDTDLAGFETQFGIQFSSDIRALYQWKNGQTAVVTSRFTVGEPGCRWRK